MLVSLTLFIVLRHCLIHRLNKSYPVGITSIRFFLIRCRQKRWNSQRSNYDGLRRNGSYFSNRNYVTQKITVVNYDLCFAQFSFALVRMVNFVIWNFFKFCLLIYTIQPKETAICQLRTKSATKMWTMMSNSWETLPSMPGVDGSCQTPGGLGH